MALYYLTFGQKYRHEVHPTFAKAHPDGYVTIEAENFRDARAFAFQAFDTAWACLYTERELSQIYFPMGELMRLRR